MDVESWYKNWPVNYKWYAIACISVGKWRQLDYSVNDGVDVAALLISCSNSFLDRGRPEATAAAGRAFSVSLMPTTRNYKIGSTEKMAGTSIGPTRFFRPNVRPLPTLNYCS